MKKILLSSFVAIAVCSIVFAQDKKHAKQATVDPSTDLKEDYQKIGSSLPTLRIVDTNNVSFTGKTFQSKHNFFLFMFNPTCGHCINMAKLIVGNYSAFKNNKIAFMASPQMTSVIGSFYQATGIGKYPEIKVGVDSAYAIEKIYNYQTLPQLNIYNNQHKLIKVFHGDITLDSLKQYLK
jgi:thiol-disulfide isomerase/thioredoxin